MTTTENPLLREHNTAIITGNQAAAEASRLARVGVVAFFPIGPSDEVGEHLVRMVNRGQLDARIIDLQNERSVVNAQITATQGGVRASFSTNSEGLVLAYQPLFWSAYARVPIVVTVAHRAMEPPTLITSDDHDTIIFRDTHWVQYYCESPQEVFDTVLQAYWVAERHDVMLPAFVTWPGWEISHSSGPVEMPSQELVDAFLPPYKLLPGMDLLATDLAEIYGDRPTGDTTALRYMEGRYQIDRALNMSAKNAIEEAHREYVRVFGRGYGGLVEDYRSEDADIVLVAMENIAAVAREAADRARERGIRVGVLKVRVLRPFPTEAVRRTLGRARVVMTLDRNPVDLLYHELRSALYEEAAPPLVFGRTVALGGRDFTGLDCDELIEEAVAAFTNPEDVPSLSWRFKVAKEE